MKFKTLLLSVLMGILLLLYLAPSLGSAVNTRPVFSEFSVSPTVGTTDDLYEVRVVYTDTEGDAPFPLFHLWFYPEHLVYLVVDNAMNNVITMEAVGNDYNYAQGVLFKATIAGKRLGKGLHTISIITADERAEDPFGFDQVRTALPIEVVVDDRVSHDHDDYHCTSAKNVQEAVLLESVRILNENTIAWDREVIVETTFTNKHGMDLEDMHITVAIPELGIQRNVGAFYFHEDQTRSQYVHLELPHDVPQGEYSIRVTVNNDDVSRVVHRTFNIW